MINDYNLANNYINGLLKKNYKDNDLKQLQEYAAENHVPIISIEIRKIFEFFLEIKKPKAILEIGTAIGYSTIILSKFSSAVVKSIEKDENMYKKAKENLSKFGIKNVELILGDALLILDDMKEKFDFIFIDAAKSKTEVFFEKSLKLLNENGMIFIDNMMCKGSVYTEIKRYKTIGKNLKFFIENKFEDINFIVLPIGDGIGIYYKGVKK